MKESIIQKITLDRFERKFAIDELSYGSILMFIKRHPARFQEIYQERSVNSIYFDTYDLEHYVESVDGVYARMKVRIRWYNELFGLIGQPFIEFKYKLSHQIGKLQYPLKPFCLNRTFSANFLRELFKESDLDKRVYSYLTTLRPTALISYQRKYFLSFDHKYRITVDRNLASYRFMSDQHLFLNRQKKDRHFIVELKYDSPWDERADEITNEFTFQLTKSSKYLSAVTNQY